MIDQATISCNFGNSMSYQINRTIKEVLNFETGEPIDADVFFQKPLDEIHLYRSELQKAINKERDKLFVCYYCKQHIRIRGGIAVPGKLKREAFHFAHLKDSDDCHIKTKTKFTKEEYDAIKYNGAKESLLHIDLKEKIAECLDRNSSKSLGISNIEVEKVIRSNKIEKEWKKPDINAFFNDKRIALELQLSTTWLDVITKRQHFYKEQKIFIFWIFHHFDIDDESRKLTYNDVIYTNNQNAFVFDYETYQKSIEENDLVLKCYYKTYTAQYLNVKEDWELAYIKLSDLVFDEINFKIYFYDSNTRKKEVEEEIEFLEKQNEERKRQLIKEERLRKKKLEEEENERKIKEEEKQIKINKRNEKISLIDQSISELHRKKTKLEDSIEKVEQLLESYSASILKVEEYTLSIIDHAHNRVFVIRFFKEKEITEQIDANIIERAVHAIQENEKFEKEIVEKREKIKNCSNLPVRVNSKEYKSLDPKTYWDFIVSMKSKVFILNKNYAQELFAENELKPISSYGHFDGLRYTKEYFILFDFSERINNYETDIVDLETKIDQNKEALKIQKSLIKEIISKYYHNELLNCTNEKEELKKDIEKIELEIDSCIKTKEIIISEPIA